MVLFLEGNLSLRKPAVPLKAHTNTLYDKYVSAFIPAIFPTAFPAACSANQT